MLVTNDSVTIVRGIVLADRLDLMEDLAVQTGGTFLTKEMGVNIRTVTRDMLGTAEYAKITKQHTLIMGAGGDPAAVQAKVNELRYLVEYTDYAFNQHRSGRLPTMPVWRGALRRQSSLQTTGYRLRRGERLLY